MTELMLMSFYNDVKRIKEHFKSGALSYGETINMIAKKAAILDADAKGEAFNGVSHSHIMLASALFEVC